MALRKVTFGKAGTADQFSKKVGALAGRLPWYAGKGARGEAAGLGECRGGGEQRREGEEEEDEATHGTGRGFCRAELFGPGQSRRIAEAEGGDKRTLLGQFKQRRSPTSNCRKNPLGLGAGVRIGMLSDFTP
jgi:hypothetical protein